ncbi:MAG: MBL fold metallo-hydrolase [Candidatus Aminicenantes bacterium]|jgi:glyoxylase-like metal-dependent hydrolase (beta-lactamase superfamily II)
MTINKIALGQFEIHGLRDGYFHLDGGAMFGVVPKPLWEKKFAADDQNRIRLALNSFLIKKEDTLILVETGIGSDLESKIFEYYSIEREPGLVSSLQRLGHKVEDINFVINTHLHFDHCGGNTYKNEKGEDAPTFPNAKYIIQKKEWEYAMNPSERDQPSYLKQNFVPLEECGQLQLVDGDSEIIEGVHVVLVPGHTSSHQCVKVKSESQIFFFLGDLVPTSGHIGLPYIMSYDLLPQVTLQNKKKIFDQAINEGWVLGFNHDPDHFFGRVEKVEDKYRFKPLHGVAS